jgi:hypothetical protein
MDAPKSQRIRDELTRLRDALNGAGVPTSLDPATVQVPGAWITPRTITDLTMGGHGTLTAHVWLIAPDVGVLEALDILNGLLELAVPIAGPVTSEGDSLDVGTSIILRDVALPAFRIITELDY